MDIEVNCGLEFKLEVRRSKTDDPQAKAYEPKRLGGLHPP